VRGALEGVERIRGITAGIRTFSRPEDAANAPIDFRGPLDAALKLVMHDLRHRARLSEDYTPTPLVAANAGRLGQVFLNLLNNAIQSFPVGGATTHEIKVATGTDDGGRAFVEVADSGEGIPDHLLPRIFEPFFSTKEVGQGNGLGLSISHGIVRSLGGEITVSSKVGRGTTFRVSLPAAPRH
jgi:signal transduction histidine kinase